MGIPSNTVVEVLGDPELQEMHPQRDWSIDDGVTTTRHFQGTAGKILEYTNQLITEGSASGLDKLSEKYTGDKGDLFLTLYDDSGSEFGGNNEELNSTWELIGRELLKPIESHRNFDLIDAKFKREIEKRAREAVALPDGSPDVWKELYAYYAHQVLDYLSTDMILRKSTKLSDRTTTTASYDGLNTVVADTLSSLTSVIGPPAAILNIVQNLPILGDSPGAWEWLKKAPRVRQITRRKFSLVHEWWGAERWAQIYGGSWEPVYEI